MEVSEHGGASGGTSPQPTWHQSLPDTLTVEHEGKAVLLRDVPFIKETPDIPTLAKRAYDNHRAIGQSLRPPGTNATPEEVKAFKQKIYGTGVFKPPPAKPEEYEIKRPDTIPEEQWSKDLEGKARSWAHKHGVTQEAMAELIALEGERFGVLTGAMREQKEQFGERVNELAAELNKEPIALLDATDRWLSKNIDKEDYEWLQARNLLHNPAIITLIAKAADASGEDISISDTLQESETTAELAEATRIMKDPTHPEHARYRQGDPATLAKVEAAYRKTYGTKEIGT